ncbi:hypothetical protein DRP04_07575, partial [Archaeoglobales archaeon]
MNDFETYLAFLRKRLFKVLLDVYNGRVNVKSERPLFKRYPYQEARPGHNEAIGEIINSKRVILAHPTGFGKTAVYLTALAELDEPSLVITPRNKLQEQTASYAELMNINMVYIESKDKECHRCVDGVAPCRHLFRIDDRNSFRLNGKLMKYPCSDCKWYSKVCYGRRMLETGVGAGTFIPVLNQGNFWLFRGDAKIVVIDEADEALRGVISAVSIPGEYEEEPKAVLEIMTEFYKKHKDKIKRKLSVETNAGLIRELERCERALRKIKFFMTYKGGKLIRYIKNGKTYVELLDSLENVASRLFWPSAEKIILVTATPGLNTEWKVTSGTIPFKSRVIIAPVGNLSVINVFEKGNRHLLEAAVKLMLETYNFVCRLLKLDKFKTAVHCGNLKKHGKMVYDLLKVNGKKPLLMVEGKQGEYIERFIKGDYDFFCGVALEYGYDWSFIPCQFIVKMPFPDLEDARVQGIRETLGEEKFKEWY